MGSRYNEKASAVILANPAMIKAYQSVRPLTPRRQWLRGLDLNQRPFERLEDTMMGRADIDRTSQIDGRRVSLMTEGVHSYSPVLMLLGT